MEAVCFDWLAVVVVPLGVMSRVNQSINVLEKLLVPIQRQEYVCIERNGVHQNNNEGGEDLTQSPVYNAVPSTALLLRMLYIFVLPDKSGGSSSYLDKPP